MTEKRHTFETVNNKSLELREKILKLIDLNIPVPDDEKKCMLELLNRSTYGIGTEESILHLYYNDDCINVKTDNLQQFIRCIIEYDKDVVDNAFFIPLFGESGSHYNRSYPISIVWRSVLYEINRFIPKTLEAAAKMSKEIISDKQLIKTMKTVKEK